MTTSNCFIRLQNPILESVSFFSKENNYSILCRFALAGKLRHALVKVSENKWNELMNHKYETASSTSLNQRLDELKKKRSWAHINLMHSYPYFSQSKGLTFLIKSSIGSDDQSTLELLEITRSGLAA